MNDELKISAKDARAVYNKADAAGKELLENLFGKETFVPKDITERVKTLADALMILGEDHKVVKEYRLLERFVFSDNLAEDILAFAELRVIAAALNEGWRPTFSENERIYYPSFYICSQKEFERFDEEKKKSYRVVRNSQRNQSVYIGYSDSYKIPSLSFWTSGPQIVFYTKELAAFCGKQFIDIWAKLIFCVN